MRHRDPPVDDGDEPSESVIRDISIGSSWGRTDRQVTDFSDTESDSEEGPTARHDTPGVGRRSRSIASFDPLSRRLAQRILTRRAGVSLAVRRERTGSTPTAEGEAPPTVEETAAAPLGAQLDLLSGWGPTDGPATPASTDGIISSTRVRSGAPDSGSTVPPAGSSGPAMTGRSDSFGGDGAGSSASSNARHTDPHVATGENAQTPTDLGGAEYKRETGREPGTAPELVPKVGPDGDGSSAARDSPGADAVGPVKRVSNWASDRVEHARGVPDRTTEAIRNTKTDSNRRTTAVRSRVVDTRVDGDTSARNRTSEPVSPVDRQRSTDATPRASRNGSGTTPSVDGSVRETEDGRRIDASMETPQTPGPDLGAVIDQGHEGRREGMRRLGGAGFVRRHYRTRRLETNVTQRMQTSTAGVDADRNATFDRGPIDGPVERDRRSDAARSTVPADGFGGPSMNVRERDPTTRSAGARRAPSSAGPGGQGERPAVGPRPAAALETGWGETENDNSSVNSTAEPSALPTRGNATPAGRSPSGTHAVPQSGLAETSMDTPVKTHGEDRWLGADQTGRRKPDGSDAVTGTWPTVQGLRGSGAHETTTTVPRSERDTPSSVETASSGPDSTRRGRATDDAAGPGPSPSGSGIERRRGPIAHLSGVRQDTEAGRSQLRPNSGHGMRSSVRVAPGRGDGPPQRVERTRRRSSSEPGMDSGDGENTRPARFSSLETPTTQDSAAGLTDDVTGVGALSGFDVADERRPVDGQLTPALPSGTAPTDSRPGATVGGSQQSSRLGTRSGVDAHRVEGERSGSRSANDSAGEVSVSESQALRSRNASRSHGPEGDRSPGWAGVRTATPAERTPMDAGPDRVVEETAVTTHSNANRRRSIARLAQSGTTGQATTTASGPGDVETGRFPRPPREAARSEKNVRTEVMRTRTESPPADDSNRFARPPRQPSSAHPDTPAAHRVRIANRSRKTKPDETGRVTHAEPNGQPGGEGASGINAHTGGERPFTGDARTDISSATTDKSRGRLGRDRSSAQWSERGASSERETPIGLRDGVGTTTDLGGVRVDERLSGSTEASRAGPVSVTAESDSPERDGSVAESWDRGGSVAESPVGRSAGDGPGRAGKRRRDPVTSTRQSRPAGDGVRARSVPPTLLDRDRDETATFSDGAVRSGTTPSTDPIRGGGRLGNLPSPPDSTAPRDTGGSRPPNRPDASGPGRITRRGDADRRTKASTDDSTRRIGHRSGSPTDRFRPTGQSVSAGNEETTQIEAAASRQETETPGADGSESTGPATVTRARSEPMAPTPQSNRSMGRSPSSMIRPIAVTTRSRDTNAPRRPTPRRTGPSASPSREDESDKSSPHSPMVTRDRRVRTGGSNATATHGGEAGQAGSSRSGAPAQASDTDRPRVRLAAAVASRSSVARTAGVEPGQADQVSDTGHEPPNTAAKTETADTSPGESPSRTTSKMVRYNTIGRDENGTTTNTDRSPAMVYRTPDSASRSVKTDESETPQSAGPDRDRGSPARSHARDGTIDPDRDRAHGPGASAETAIDPTVRRERRLHEVRGGDDRGDGAADRSSVGRQSVDGTSIDRPRSPRATEPDAERQSARSERDARQPDRGRRDVGIADDGFHYEADVDRVVERLYRKLERKRRIERERRGKR